MRSLQLTVLQTVVLGWLLYSTSPLHTHTLAHHLSLAIGCPVGLQWRIIYTGSCFSKDTPKSVPVRALHIEASKPDAAKVKSFLCRMYSSKPDIEPVLGIRMRLIPEKRVMTSPAGVAKVEQMYSRQEAYCKHVVTVTTWELCGLDFVDPVLGTDLRTLLMSITSTEHPGQRLFQAVKQRYWTNQGGYVFVVLPQLADKVCPLIAGLLPYL